VLVLVDIAVLGCGVENDSNLTQLVEVDDFVCTNDHTRLFVWSRRITKTRAISDSCRSRTPPLDIYSSLPCLSSGRDLNTHNNSIFGIHCDASHATRAKNATPLSIRLC
jgi:hypothetical protein